MHAKRLLNALVTVTLGLLCSTQLALACTIGNPGDPCNDSTPDECSEYSNSALCNSPPNCPAGQEPVIVADRWQCHGAGGGDGGGGGGSPSTPPPTAGVVPTGSFPSTPPAISGALNEGDGRENIDDALDLFGSDGLLAGASAAGDGGDRDAAAKKDEGANNGRKDGKGGFGAAVGLADTLKGGFGDGANGSRSLAGAVAAVGGTGALSGSDNKDAKDQAAALAAQAVFGSAEGEGRSFGDGAGQGGTGAVNGANGATTGEVGNDGPGGAGHGGAGENADEYLKRTGKLSLFEIINRRYEIWGSQIQR